MANYKESTWYKKAQEKWDESKSKKEEAVESKAPLAEGDAPEEKAKKKSTNKAKVKEDGNV